MTDLGAPAGHEQVGLVPIAQAMELWKPAAMVKQSLSGDYPEGRISAYINWLKVLASKVWPLSGIVVH